MAALSAERRRTCIGCRRARPVSELIRFAMVGEQLQVGRSLPGRGAWVCAAGDSADEDCLRRAVTGDRLRRAFRRAVPSGAAEDLIAALRRVDNAVAVTSVPRAF